MGIHVKGSLCRSEGALPKDGCYIPCLFRSEDALPKDGALHGNPNGRCRPADRAIKQTQPNQSDQHHHGFEHTAFRVIVSIAPVRGRGFGAQRADLSGLGQGGPGSGKRPSSVPEIASSYPRRRLADPLPRDWCITPIRGQGGGRCFWAAVSGERGRYTNTASRN
jgi:hypothetical protein